MVYRYLLHPVSVGDWTRRLPYSPNTTNGMHWAIRGKWKAEWQNMTYWATRQAKVPALKKPTIWVTVYAHTPQDRDNCFASLKGVFDGIVMAGVVENDDNDHCTMEVEQIKVSKRADEKIEVVLRGTPT